MPITSQVLNYKRVLQSGNVLEIYRNTHVPLFVCSLFNEAGNNSDYVASGDLTILIMNWKACGMERSGLNLSYPYGIVFEGLEVNYE